MPPLRPTVLRIPMAAVNSIHLFGERVKLLRPASVLKASNSTPLKFGLLIFSHRPMYSMVVRLRSQFLTTSLGSAGFLTRAMSVSER